MSTVALTPATAKSAAPARTTELFAEALTAIHVRTDRMFAFLMIGQWLAGIAAAVWISPLTWIGSTSLIHWHVWAAIFLGGAITAFPVLLVWKLPGHWVTRHAIAVAQMLTSALLIHLTGGRLETHFHIFGSLAFIAFYRDWRVLLTATVVVAADHMLRGIYWPQSVFGVLANSSWRWVEHAGWALFEDAFLLLAIRQGLRDLQEVATRRTHLEQLNTEIETLVAERTAALTLAQVDLQASEQRFSSAFSNAVLAMALVAPTGRWLKVNRALCELLGYSASELEQETFQNLTHPEDLPVDLELVRSLLAGEINSYQIEKRYLHRSGRVVWGFLSVSLVRDAAGQPGYFIAQIQDITERRRADELIRLQGAALHSTANVVVITDREGLIVWTNPAFTKVTGYTADEALGKNPRVLRGQNVPNKYPAHYYQDLWKTISSGGVWQGEFHNARKDGSLLIEEATITPVPNAAGEITHFVAVKQDITTRKNIEAELASERELLRALLDHSPDHIFFKDADSRFIRASTAQAVTLGVPSAAELVGKSDADFFSAEHAAATQADEQRILSTGQPLIGKVDRLITKTGRIIWALTTKMPLRNNAGAIIGTFGSSKDISALKAAEAELRKSTDFLQSTLDALSAHIAILDEAGNVIAVNAVWRQFANQNDFLGSDYGIGANYLHLCDSVSGDCAAEAPAVAAGIRAVLAGECPEFQLEYPCHSAQEQRWFIVRITRFERANPVRVVVAHENVTARKQAETQLRQVHQELVETSRLAGMAEVATGVLHNVGNVLNSVNVASTCIADNLRKSKAANLTRVVGLLRDHEPDLGTYLTADPKGKQIPGYLAQLAEHLAGEQTSALTELAELQKHIDHIKDIVAMQQSFAKVSGVTESLNVADLVEDALRMHSSGLARHDIQVVKEFAPLPPVALEKQKVLQILVNLVTNAKQACDAARRDDKQMTLRIMSAGERVHITIADNGVGIPPENLTRIFNHGFTTKKDGHGFGLHSGAIAAKEMGGTLRVHSDGVDRGTTFTLELPLNPRRQTYA